ncbi:transposase family protein, partial [Streptomyces altiplanensis]
GTFATGQRCRPGKELSLRQKSLYKAHARLRYPVERGMARLKTWRIFRKARCSPTWLTSAAKAVLTLERYR